MAPAAASQLIFESVGMEDNTKVATAATATKTAVQVAWLEMALSPIEILRMADPETKTQSVNKTQVSTTACGLDRIVDGLIAYTRGKPLRISHAQCART